ncbi:cytochrome c3 family protein [Fundidesulfovibrio terrae]|uniref:cytochrome c3 family protein n=1 Tax=Fundidesulfovibrio terrae TaxID=2922866 RepID=UPI001FAF5B5F
MRLWKWVLPGLAAGLAAAWLGYPRLAWVALTQPIRFSHSVHARQDVACTACHANAPGGAFNGFPSIEVCAGCHPDPTGGRSEDEKEADKLVSEYVKKHKDVPWLSMVREPDHVYFPHAPHLSGKPAGCASCHPDMAREDYPELKRNRISGYLSRTMPMARCRACHQSSRAADDCVVCHR